MLTGVPFPKRPDTAGMSYFVENFAFVRYWYTTAITLWPASLPMFLVGLYIGRRRFFENIGAHRKGLKRTLIAGLAGGVLAVAGLQFLAMTWGNSPRSIGQQTTAGLLWTIHAWGLAAFYASSLLLLLQGPSWQRRLAPIGAVGRMALTNYLLQSVLIVPVCLAFDLFDKVTPSMGLLIALGLWAIQVPASVWWLRHFRFGPAEWLWRSLSYGRPQQMRNLQAIGSPQCRGHAQFRL